MQEVEPGMGLYSPEEQIKNDIWPQSTVFWMGAFYMALFILRPWEKLFPWMGTIHFERIYALFMIAAILLSINKGFRMTSQSVTVLFFLGAIGLSGILARNPSLSWNPFYIYLTLVIFYFSLIFVIRSPYELIFMLICYIVVMAIYLTKAQWEYFVNGAGVYRMEVYRLVGIECTFSDPNSLASSIVYSLPILWFLWSFHKEISSEWPHFWRKWFPIFLIGYFILALSSLILTNSRSGMVSFILFLVLVCLKGRNFGKKLGYILLGILFLALTWQIMPGETKNRFRSIWDKDAGPVNAQASTQGRIEGFKAGIAVFKRFPLTGVGPGNFVAYRVSHLDGAAVQPHNMVGQIMGETGLVGATAFFLMVFITLLNCQKIAAYAKNGPDPTTEILANFAVSCRDVIILLIFEGLAGHNLLRFNWLWIAAFSNITLQYIKYNPLDVHD